MTSLERARFYATDLAFDSTREPAASESLIVCGVTTEVCVHHNRSRGSNDRGFLLHRSRGLSLWVVLPQNFTEVARLRMIKAQGGAIFGWVSSSKAVLEALVLSCIETRPGYTGREGTDDMEENQKADAVDSRRLERVLLGSGPRTSSSICSS